MAESRSTRPTRPRGDYRVNKFEEAIQEAVKKRLKLRNPLVNIPEGHYNLGEFTSKAICYTNRTSQEIRNLMALQMNR